MVNLIHHAVWRHPIMAELFGDAKFVNKECSNEGCNMRVCVRALRDMPDTRHPTMVAGWS